MADIKISELPVATGPIEDDDILLLVRGGVTYQISGQDHETLGVVSFNTRDGEVFLTSQDVTDALQYFPVQQNTTPFRIYGTNASGQQSLVTYSQGGALSLTLAQRTAQGQLDASTVSDDSPQAGDNNLINRAYAQELRSDRITTINSNVSAYTITSDKDGVIVSGLDAANLAITLPSALQRYKRVLIKFRANVTALTINAGTDVNVLPNTIDYSPASANAGDLFEWGYDVATSTWLVTNYVSFNTLP
jgi:hypothetical protein